MNVIVIGGFLGAGKTSFLMKAVNHIIKEYGLDDENPLAIIENEIGEINIDSQALASDSYSVTNLFSGCICCTLEGDLKNTIKRIKDELHPKWLVIETTGLAFPDRIKKSLFKYTNEGEVISTIVLVDASRYFKLLRCATDFIVYQIKAADVLLINKTDLCEHAEINKIKEDIKNINYDAKQFEISLKADDIEKILNALPRVN